jgi:hypothetical protein
MEELVCEHTLEECSQLGRLPIVQARSKQVLPTGNPQPFLAVPALGK